MFDKKIITVFFILFVFATNTAFTQTYFKSDQNKTYTVDSSTKTVFFKTATESININLDLNMIQFVDSNDTFYGFDSPNPIPSNWNFRIDRVDNCSDCSLDVQSFTYSGNPNENIELYIEVYDNDTNEIINKLGDVKLTIYIRDKLTVVNSIWSSCLNAQKITLNEIFIDADKICNSYSAVLYNAATNEIIESQTVTSTSSNIFTFTDLPLGDYKAEFTNSCANSVYTTFSVNESYNFNSKVIFAGYECFDSVSGTALIQIEGATVDENKEINWTINDSNGNVIISNTTSSLYQTNNFNPEAEFETVNFSITVPSLNDGDYTFNVTDYFGCVDIEPFSISKPKELAAEIVTEDSNLDLLCYGDTDGKMIFLATGGWTEPESGENWKDPYTMVLTNIETNVTYEPLYVIPETDINDIQIAYKANFSNLPAGSYSLTVSEVNGIDPYDASNIFSCSKTLPDTFIITEPEPLVLTEIISDFNGYQISCNGESDGAIDLTVTGGTSPYSFVWSKNGVDFSTTEDISNVTSGTYQVIVTDANSCTIENTYTLAEADELLIEIDPSSTSTLDCYDDSGLIKVNVTQQSVGNYTFNLTGVDYANNAVSSSGTNSTSFTFSNLKAGNYSITVVDQNGCSKTTSDWTIYQPLLPITISSQTISQVSCF